MRTQVRTALYGSLLALFVMAACTGSSNFAEPAGDVARGDDGAPPADGDSGDGSADVEPLPDGDREEGGVDGVVLDSDAEDAPDVADMRVDADPVDVTVIDPPSGWNFRHIRVWDFGRGRDYLRHPDDRAAAWDFFASHVDVAEADTLVAVEELHRRNPAMRVFHYDVDITACIHVGCVPNSVPRADPPGAEERFYLHYSEETELFFRYITGATDSMTVPGCTADELRRECRVRTAIWEDQRWVYNPGAEGFAEWHAGILLQRAEPYDGVFLDEHGPGLALSDDVVSGGGILEYGGRTQYEVTEDYNAHLTAALAVYNRAFAATGRFVVINGANWSLRDPLMMNQIAAAGGTVMEFQHRPDAYDGASDFERAIRNSDWLLERGALIDLFDSPCRDLDAFGYTSPGLYSSPFARWQMWRLAAYYLMREMPDGSSGSGIVFFDPNLCMNFVDHERALDFIDEWLPAYEVDFGDPDGPRDPRPFASGASPVPCPGQASVATWGVLSRSYDDGNALVLVRPRDRWDCRNYGDETAVTIPLPEPMRLLRDDGTFAPDSPSIVLRNGEAAILLR